MTSLKNIYREKFDKLKCCVLIPTYNNEKTLFKVISDVLEYTGDVIVVNDGSTDSTRNILESFTQIKVVQQPRNMGKGMALRTGFKAAFEQGYQYAITIDSDGQHMASDLPVFIDKIEKEPGTLIVGARNMEQSSVPGKSSFGHKFSNFWFWFETGVKLPDTQSGYRLYPLEPLYKMKWFTRKYEFEIENIVRASWKGVKVDSVPVQVYYGKERVTHFRPFKDFSRVSVLNTILVVIAILFIKPFKVIRSLNRNSIADFFKKYVFNRDESDLRKTLSVMFGVFMGIVPIWGFQLIVGITLAHLMRLNKVLFVTAAHISIPPMIPILIFLSYKAGGMVLPNGKDVLIFNRDITLENVKADLFQYTVGSMLLAVAAAVLFGLITYLLLKVFPAKQKLNTEISS
ncbi:DUF2062 domain-containing protein [Sporocytophaga myxococcoides]|nr:DUF2062 domain-containing protein [Sporocytophaga myxococcoides]